MPEGVRAAIPNAITMLRLVVAAGFFAALAVGLRTEESTRLWGNLAVWMFAFAAITDVIDGWLARRWQVVSVFGRVMDPVVDKVLVLGAFIFLAAPPFAASEPGRLVSAIAPWMVVVILTRELLVTSVRGVLEAEGIAFGADRWGKIKMFVQSVTVPVSLFVAVNQLGEPGSAWKWLRDGLVWGTVAVTVLSALPYAIRGQRLMATVGRSKETRGS
ncbi:MAG: CDP-alcohol phosphatidyltransferase family protein [Phycisphaeraceae bacterium]|nr:CDP-alcohol phosphatidyltransferase family protein [Phycisphaeraceae bacterium]